MDLILTGFIESFPSSESTVNEMVLVEGSVRVDLLGGTLDLIPINLILPHVVTLNLATSLKAKVKISTLNFDGIEIVSHDYNETYRFKCSDWTDENLRNNFFGNATFIAHILNHFKFTRGARLELESGSPPGAGLGGSSAMGVTCYSAISKFLKIPFLRETAIEKINAIEAIIIDCPAGYQDYYPALYGGVLGLIPQLGSLEVVQLFSEELKKILEENITLVYSGETRNSGINNWEVYKAFFNKDLNVRNGLLEIAKLANSALLAIKEKNYEALFPLIKAEGVARKKLFPGIMTTGMQQIEMALEKKSEHFGIKVCGAGGGGCFLITHKKEDHLFIDDLLKKYQMKKLIFNVEKPL